MGLSHLAYRLPSQRYSLEELSENALLESDASFLRSVGFESCYGQSEDCFEALVIQCGRELLADAALPRDRIGWLFWCFGVQPGAESGDGSDELLARFRYPVARAQHEMDLPAAKALALSQQGCSGLLSGIALAESVLRSTDTSAVLCLAGDALPGGSRREILYNLMSDAAAAVLVEKGTSRNRILHFYQHTVPYYWDTPQRTHEIMASYFPLAQRVIQHTLDQAGLTVEDVAWFVPHNVSWRSWMILADLLRVPESRIWIKNIARLGHTVSCDHIINLCDMEAEGELSRGDILLLFTFGFGANWTCMLLEH